MVKNKIFTEKTFADCSLEPCQRTAHHQISWRKLSRIATKPWNSPQFSPSKLSHYMVPLYPRPVWVQGQVVKECGGWTLVCIEYRVHRVHNTEYTIQSTQSAEYRVHRVQSTEFRVQSTWGLTRFYRVHRVKSTQSREYIRSYQVLQKDQSCSLRAITWKLVFTIFE